MKIQKFKHTGVREDGTFINDRGSVHTTPGIQLAETACECGCSGDQPYVVVGFGRTEDGIVEGITITFDDADELENFLEGHRVTSPRKFTGKRERTLEEKIMDIESRVAEVDGRYTCLDCGHEWSAMMGDNEIPLVCECNLDYDKKFGENEIVYNPLSNVIMIAGDGTEEQLAYENEHYIKIVNI